MVGELSVSSTHLSKSYQQGAWAVQGLECPPVTWETLVQLLDHAQEIKKVINSAISRRGAHS